MTRQNQQIIDALQPKQQLLGSLVANNLTYSPPFSVKCDTGHLYQIGFDALYDLIPVNHRERGRESERDLDKVAANTHTENKSVSCH